MSQSSYSLFIDYIPGETRAALLKDEELVDIRIDRSGFKHEPAPKKESIYLGRVRNVVPSLQAAFIDIGNGPNGFLPVSGTAHDDISKAVHEGQNILVQVRKEAQADKGPLLTSKIELNSTHAILTSGAPGINVSRKIKNNETRETLKTALQDFNSPEFGLVIRTGAKDIALQELSREVETLTEKWTQLSTHAQGTTHLVQSAQSFFEQLATDYASLPLEEVMIEGIEAYQEAKAYFPTAQSYSATQALFDAHHVQEQIDQALQSVIKLPQGGDIHIEHTTALCAVDVNMGNLQGSADSEDNIYKLNLAALKELRAHISLRNLSGQVVVDFIRLKNKRKQHSLLDKVKQAFQDDPRSVIHGFSRMGLLEISRKREGFGLHELHDNALSDFNALVRMINHTPTLKSIELGSQLFNLWHSDETKETRLWLQNRLSALPKISENKNLSTRDWKISE